MLWYKGWFETRFKIAVALGFGLFFVFTLRNANPMSAAALEGAMAVLAFYWALMPFLLAGAGIRTQASFRATKGLHGSWSIWSSMAAVFGLRWVLPRISALPSVDLFQAMGKSSPLFTHTLPWASMGVSLCAAAILFAGAARVNQMREY